MKVIFPKTLATLIPHDPVFFLAGPVRGGDDWQLKLCKEIRRQICEQDFYAVIPYYHNDMPADHELFAFKVSGDENHFGRQLPWERHYLNIASKSGAVIFWLPAESKKNPRQGGGYATDTRGEIGEWRGRMMYDPSLKVVVGGEPGFPDISQIERNFRHAISSDFPIYRTIKETVAAAIRMI